MRRAMTSPKRGFLFSIAILMALTLGAPSGALAETGLDASSPAVQPDGVLVAQTGGIKIPKISPPTLPQAKQVPDVTGKPQADAERRLSRAGFKSVVRPVPTRDPAQVGKVKRQRPPAGQKHLLIMPVGLEVWELEKVKGRPGGLAAEGEDVQVPDVKGKPQTEAERLLEGKGLRHQVAMRVPTTDRQQAGKVASQSPEAGKTVPKGTKVALFVLRYMAPPGGGGPPPGLGGGGGGSPSRVNTPGVIGMTRAEAERKLRDAGFGSRVRSLVATGDQSRDGRVKFHQPPPGMPVTRGTTVSLDVWAYTTAQVQVPNVMGKLKREAVGDLTSAGLRSKVVDIPTTDPRKDGIVDAQAPIAGRMVAPDTLVNLGAWWYQGARLKVPNVVGKTQVEAARMLSSAGLGMDFGRTKPVDTTDRNKFGKVKAQRPAAGREVPKGASVALDIWWEKGVGFSLSIPIIGPPVTVTSVLVPHVLGMTKAEAERALRDRGFGSKVKGVIVTDITGLGGKVSSQEPDGGKWVDSGTTVSLDIYKLAPRVVGMKFPAAVEKLRSAGFSAHVKRRWPRGGDRSKENTVTHQYPARTGPSGSGWKTAAVRGNAPPGPNSLVGNVGVDLYKYEEFDFAVPNVVGLSINEAEKRLKTWPKVTSTNQRTGRVTITYAEFEAKVNVVDTGDVTKDCKVIKQDPAGGTRMWKGSEVLLDVYRYKGGFGVGGIALVSSCAGLFQPNR